MTSEPSHTFRRLKPEEIIATAELLSSRISERFPDSNLSKVSQEILTVAREAHHRSEWMNRPILGLRILVVVIIAAFCVALFFGFQALNLKSEVFNTSEALQTLEAVTNEVILLGAGLFFLITLELRWKRTRGLKALQELRSLAHVIDLHQLKKDPARLDRSPTLWMLHSPPSSLDRFHLSRYLDYCSELLSIIGKVAALYAHEIGDPVLLGAVDEVENLTNGLSRKIWQKIMIVEMNKG